MINVDEQLEKDTHWRRTKDFFQQKPRKVRILVSMASFPDKVMSALKENETKKNSRSPLDDPFFAESLIIQSKSIVGRMYSANEYARFKYECELNQLVKEYRVWLAEIKREEREVLGKLECVRQEQREMRQDVGNIHLVAEKSNREFIDHYKKRRRTKQDGKSKHSVNNFRRHPMNQLRDDFARTKAKLESTRLPEIVKVKKAVEVMGVTGDSVPPNASISFPLIRTAQKENRLGIAATRGVNSEKTYAESKKSKCVELAESTLPNIEANALRSRNKLPRVLSAPKSKREGGNLDVFTPRPSSACETVFLEN